MKPFRSYPPKDRKPAIDTLVNSKQIIMTEIKTAGRKRFAYVASKVEDYSE